MKDNCRILIFVDDDEQPIADLLTPVQFELDTSKLADGPHVLKLVSKSPNGKEGMELLNFEVRNGPAIDVEGIVDNAIIDGIVPIMINSYDKGDSRKFNITGSETPSSIPTWIWILLISFFAWAAFYTIRFYYP